MNERDRTRIFVTVGAQIPFDRLVRTVDAWAGGRADVECFAQIGEGGVVPRNMPWTELLPPGRFREELQRADLVVAHAGMGTIISALQYSKPLLVMPRRAVLRETRNDHQVATADRFAELQGISVARDEAELLAALASRVGGGGAAIDADVGAHASPELLAAVRRFLSER